MLPRRFPSPHSKARDEGDRAVGQSSRTPVPSIRSYWILRASLRPAFGIYRGNSRMKVLDGIRVVDLSRVLAGPHCAQLLADFGANVIKVEAPGGDENRSWPPHGPDGQSANFASVNRGKRSLVLDLKTPAARDILLRLAANADVLIHSFLPDTADRLGISLERLRADNPRLIVATISGYGAEGPLADKRGYDLM